MRKIIIKSGISMIIIIATLVPMMATALMIKSTAVIPGGLIDDGVYALKNKVTGEYLDIEKDSYKVDHHIQQYPYGIDPSTASTRSGLFKFTHRGLNKYIIRTMRNNFNTFYRTDTNEVLTTSVDPIDENNNVNMCWYLSDAGDGYYYLRPYNSTKCLCAPIEGKFCITDSLYNAGERAKWEVREYDGNTISGVKVSYSEPQIIDMGSYTYISPNNLQTVYFYSTVMGVNDRGSVVNVTLNSPTDDETTHASNIASYFSGYILGVNGRPGMVSVTVEFSNAISEPLNIYFKPIYGEYFFLQNVIPNVNSDNIGYVKSYGTYAKKTSFDYDDRQIWVRLSAGEGSEYYYIKNMDGKYLTAPNTVLSGENILLESTLLTGNDLNRQKWKFEDAPSNSGNIMIKSASMSNLCLNINQINNNLTQNTYDSNNSNYYEFELVRLGNDVVYLSTIEFRSPINPEITVNSLCDFYDSFMLVHMLNHLGIHDSGQSSYKTIALDLIENSKIAIINGHGSYRSIVVTDCVSKRILNTDIFLSNDVHADFSDVEIVIFAGCETAKEENGINNMAQSAVLAGAEVAIGWAVDQYSNEMKWIEYLFKYMGTVNDLTNQLYTISEAASKANLEFDENDVVRQVNIYGNTNFRLN